MKSLKVTYFFLFSVGMMFLTVPSFAGKEAGNGGDHIRATFFQMGNAVVRYLRAHPNGLALVNYYKLDTNKLEGLLSPEFVTVVDGPLIDNTGSIVDERGVPNKIELERAEWREHVRQSNDMYYLVFHALLRGAGVPDDGYPISSKARPFPESFKIPRYEEMEFVPKGQNRAISQYVLDVENSNYQGNGCPSFGRSVDIGIETDTGIVRLDFYRLRTTTLPLSEGAVKTCKLSIQLKTPVGKRLVVSEFSATNTIFSIGDAKLFARYGISLVGQVPELFGGTVSKNGSGGGTAGLGRVDKEIVSRCGKPLSLNILGEVGARFAKTDLPNPLQIPNTIASSQIEAMYFVVREVGCAGLK